MAALTKEICASEFPVSSLCKRRDGRQSGKEKESAIEISRRAAKSNWRRETMGETEEKKVEREKERRKYGR